MTHKTAIQSLPDFKVQINNLNYPNFKTLYAYSKTAKYTSTTLIIRNYGRLLLAKSSEGRTDFNKSNKPIRREDSLYRARESVYLLANANIRQDIKPLFCTLTFKKNETDLSRANADFRNFIKRLQRYSRTNLLYLTVPEQQKRGAWHYHVLFFNLSYIPVLQFKKIWSHGYVDMQLAKINDSAAYLTKYFTKAYLQVPPGRRAYFTSRNLLRPITTHDNIEIEQIEKEHIQKKSFVKIHINSNNYIIQYDRKNPNSSTIRKSKKRNV